MGNFKYMAICYSLVKIILNAPGLSILFSTVDEMSLPPKPGN
jgi:hypothetical protein